MSEDAVFSEAISNNKADIPVVLKANEVCMDDEFDFTNNGDITLILSNKDRYYGANMLLRKDVLESIGNNLYSDYYIVPADVHTLLIFPVSDDIDLNLFKSHLWEINQTVLDPCDVLSFSIYKYIREDGLLEIAA